MERAPERELEHSVFESQAPEPELEPSQNPAGSEALVSSTQYFLKELEVFLRLGSADIDKRVKSWSLQGNLHQYFKPRSKEKV